MDVTRGYAKAKKDLENTRDDISRLIEKTAAGITSEYSLRYDTATEGGYRPVKGWYLNMSLNDVEVNVHFLDDSDGITTEVNGDFLTIRDDNDFENAIEYAAKEFNVTEARGAKKRTGVTNVSESQRKIQQWAGLE